MRQAACVQGKGVVGEWLRLGRSSSSLAAARDAFELAEALPLRKGEHGVPQEPICLGLITAAIGLEPGDDVGIQTHGDGLFDGPVELADLATAPIENRGSGADIGKFYRTVKKPVTMRLDSDV